MDRTYNIIKTILICLMISWSWQSYSQSSCYAAGTNLSFTATPSGSQNSTIQGGCSDGSSLDWQVGTKPSWLSAYRSGSTVVVTVSNNTGAARSGSVQLVKNGSQIGVFSVSQAAGLITVGQVSITSGLTQRCMGGGTSDYNAAATNATSYSWSITNAWNSTINSSGTVNWDSSFFGTAIVQVTANGPNNSSTTATRSVTVTGVSTPGLQTDTTEFCDGGSATLTLGPLQSSVKYQLLRDDVVTGQEITTNASGTPGGTSWNVTNGGEYSIRATQQTGSLCSVTYGSLTITKKSGMGSPSITGPSQLCSGTTQTDFNISGGNVNNTYSWSLINGGSATINSSTGVVTWNGFSGNVTIRLSATAQCGTSTDVDKSVSFNLISTPGLQTDTTEFCDGGSATLTLGPLQSSVKYQLLRDDVVTGQEITTNASGTPGGTSWNVTNGGEYSIRATQQTGSLCSVTYGSLTITKKSGMGSPSITGPNQLCSGTTQTDFDISGGNINNTYSWNVDGVGNTIDSSGTVSWATDYTGDATISVTATSECGSTTTLTKTVEVASGPSLTVNDSENTCSSPTDITLTALSVDYQPTDLNIQHRWWNSELGGSYINGTSDPNIPYYNSQLTVSGQSKDYWVSAVYNGCESERQKVSAVYNSSLNCGPVSCQAYPVSNVSLSALGDSETVTISFVDSGNCSGPYYLEHPYDPNADLSWLNISPASYSNGNVLFTLSVGINNGSNSLTTPLALVKGDGTGSGNRIPVGGVNFTVTQATCLTAWYPDTDGDKFGDKFGASFVGCSAPDYGDGITWVQNNDDLCPETYSLENQGCPAGQIPENFNTITTSGYDIEQNLKVASKRYFNELGRPMQSQRWNLRTNDVWASEILYDTYARPALQTLSSPIRSGNSFSYKDGFIKQENSNNDYSIDDFTGSNSENPNPVGEQENTLGWYYSENNSREEYQDVTDFPFVKTTYSELMPGTPLKSIGGNRLDTDGSGAIDGNDSWAQSYTFSMRASKELSQANAFGDTEYDNIETIKTIVRDVHGVENVVFTDLDGKTLAAARSGGTATPVNMTIAIGEQGYVDIHVPQGTSGFTIDEPSFSISGPNITVHDLITELTVDPNQTSNLPPGFYRVSINYLETFYNPNDPVVITYKVNYYDYSLNEYDEANRLKVAYQPIKDGNGNRLKTMYTYDHLDRLIKIESPETGAAEYIYRKDGQIRFSQNSKQAVNNEVSFTNYDYLGRPVKSGVWTNTTFANLDENSSVVVSDTKEVLETEYDAVPDTDNTLQSLSQAYQFPSFLSGNVARTKNDYTTTYYSYDIYGRVKWMVQDIVDLGLKTIDYNYDQVTGLVTEVDFQREVASERFIHHYLYDDSNQLLKVETSTNGSDKIVHAEYEYYENGTMKRKVLAGVQGVDYVYNLEGQLKAINHPNQTSEKDPGKDGSSNSGTQPDLFGMQIDYHNNDYNRSVDNITSMSYDENLFNGNIKAVRWNSGIAPSGSSEKLYQYSYDRNNWLTEADYAIYNPDGDGNTLPAFDDIGVYEAGETQNQVATESITLKPPFHAKSGSNYSAKIISASSIQEIGNGDYDVTGIEYDANGNIKKLTRNKNTINGENTMDALTYEYYQDATNGMNTGTPNQLQNVADAVTRNTEADDIKGQAANNYQYNEIGQLIENTSEGISYIYNTTGLVTEVQKDNKTAVKFIYNDKWQRIKKERFSTDGVTLLETTYYVRDMQGMPLAVYSKTPGNSEKLTEHSIYGDSRIGVYQRYDNASDVSTYELTDHLGNVRAVFSINGSNTTNESFANYYPFGMDMPGPQNTLSANFYRYAFQGQEKDDETNKEAFELRLWDARIGRWLTTDPAGQYDSPYLGMGNNPVVMIDPDGGYAKWDAWIRRTAAWIAGKDPSEIYKSGKDWGYNTINEDGSIGFNYGRGFYTPGGKGPSGFTPVPTGGGFSLFGTNPNVEALPDVYIEAGANGTTGTLGVEVKLLGTKFGFQPELGKRTFYSMGGGFDTSLEDPLIDNFHLGLSEPNSIVGFNGGFIAGGGALYDLKTNTLSEVTVNALVVEHVTTFHTNGLKKGEISSNKSGINIGGSWGAGFIGMEAYLKFGFYYPNHER